MVSERPSAIRRDTQGRLHCEDGPACAWEHWGVYAWHGLVVDASVITEPPTVERIAKEQNAEIRRILIERMGYERYLVESGAVPVDCDRDQYGRSRELYRLPDQYALSVFNATVEPDGSFRRYVLPLHPELRPMRRRTDGRVELGGPQMPTCLNAVASTFGLRGEQYAPAAES